MSQADKQSNQRLTTRDSQILEHVVRHRITTNEVLQKLFFSGQRRNAVTKVTSRLCQLHFLCKFPLVPPRTYFTLGMQASALLGISDHRTHPLGPQSLPTEYAALAYATLGTRYHRRLTTAEIRQRCPWMPSVLAQTAHTLDATLSPPCLELIRADLGGGPDHVARKCDADVQARKHFAEFGRLIADRAFRLVVVTGTTEKAAAIRESLDAHVWPDRMQILIAVVPDLLPLTASSSHAS